MWEENTPSIFKTDALRSELIQIKEKFKSQKKNQQHMINGHPLKNFCYFVFQEGDMLKYLLWFKLVKNGKN